MGNPKAYFIALCIVVGTVGQCYAQKRTIGPTTGNEIDFCSSLKRVVADAPNNFRNVANVQVTGFSNCHTVSKTGVAYTCEKPTPENIIANVKRCFLDWTKKLDMGSVLILGTADDLTLTVTMDRSRMVDGNPTVTVTFDTRMH
jgi:hypothetical protein